MRDKLKSFEYFTNYILKKESSTVRFSKLLTENKDNPNANLMVAHRTIFSNSYQELIALYSSGTPVKELIQPYSKTLEYMEKGWGSVGGYYQMVWMLSIGIMLEIEDTAFNKLVALVDRGKLEDYVIDYLIAYRIKDRKISDHLKFPIPYKGIMEVIKLGDNKDAAIHRLAQYLNKEWYQGHSDAYWYNNDKGKSDTYFGYWSWESGAIVKIMKLDGTILKDQKYYPYDMAN